MPKFSDMSPEDIVNYFKNSDSTLTREVIIEKYSIIIQEKQKSKIQAKLITKLLSAANAIGDYRDGKLSSDWQIKFGNQPFSNKS